MVDDGDQRAPETPVPVTRTRKRKATTPPPEAEAPTGEAEVAPESAKKPPARKRATPRKAAAPKPSPAADYRSAKLGVEKSRPHEFAGNYPPDEPRRSESRASGLPHRCHDRACDR